MTRNGNPAVISWGQLQRQIGAHYRDPKNFKRRVRKTLGTIQTLYPHLQVAYVPGGLRLSPGPLLITPR